MGRENGVNHLWDDPEAEEWDEGTEGNNGEKNSPSAFKNPVAAFCAKMQNVESTSREEEEAIGFLLLPTTLRIVKLQAEIKLLRKKTQPRRCKNAQPSPEELAIKRKQEQITQLNQDPEYQQLCNQLALRNWRFVVKLAAKNHSPWPLWDKIEAGMAGALHAAEKFDVRMGNRFVTYAQAWIKSTIQREAKKSMKIIRTGQRDAEQLLAATTARFLHESGHMPSPEEIVSKLMEAQKNGKRKTIPGPLRTPQGIQEFARQLQESNTISLNAGRYDEHGKGGALLDSITYPEGSNAFPNPEIAVANLELRRCVNEALGNLSAEELSIVQQSVMHLGDASTLRELGRQYETSHERIRQIQEKALEKLRGLLRQRGIPVPDHRVSKQIRSPHRARENPAAPNASSSFE